MAISSDRRDFGKNDIPKKDTLLKMDKFTGSFNPLLAHILGFSNGGLDGLTV